MRACLTMFLLTGCLLAASAFAIEEEPVERTYRQAPPAPRSQLPAAADAKSNGCLSCHVGTDEHTMHRNPGVVLGCTDCHGGDSTVTLDGEYSRQVPAHHDLMERAHVLPRFPGRWNWPSSANPASSYAALNDEDPAFIRFINPGDLRVAREACGACHADIVTATERSLMATTTMFWGGAAYNNGILPFKRYILGEAYTAHGEAAALENPVPVTEAMRRKGIIERVSPLPPWEVTPPADVFRVFERGGRVIPNLFPETGLPNVIPQVQRLDEPGRPDLRQSNRGPGTGLRIAVPVLNMHKTRLNDPLLWFLGTNDQPGDYRSSGCTGCHVVYANDRDPKHSGPYAAFGHRGKTATGDRTIPRGESGHPIRHEFTRAIPTSQCMVCHMHQPNMFVNTFLGYTMWDYESDAPAMWPEEQQYPDDAEIRRVNERNPEGAAPKGKWADVEFLAQVSAMNAQLEDTQFADYHGHGWNFRAVFKRDREGNLLDEAGEIVASDDPDKFDKAVHMSSIHADRGMHCVDCHFSQDNHGNGHIYGEVAQAVEIECVDCHGTADRYPDLKTSGPAARPGGNDLSLRRTPDGRRQFEWINGSLYQRSMLDPDREWEMSLVRDSVDPSSRHYNADSARAKTVSSDPNRQRWGISVAPDDRAHQESEVACMTCHTSWTTACAGCHLPIEANWKTERHRYEGGETRNFATYNPQVARNDIFQLGRHGEAKGNKIVPVRSSSALVLSSTNVNRERIYTQQPPVSASGYSSQAFAPHFPHTVRREETKRCSDCHVSEANDNNAIMAQLLLLGTNWVNFVGFHAYVGQAGEISAVQVTEWEEPQAVIGSYLHRYAYPDWYAAHGENRGELQNAWHHDAGEVGCLQLRGEYLYTADADIGLRILDVASVSNKGFSQRIVTAPFSELGHDTEVETASASCVALPTNQPIAPQRNVGELMRDINQEQPFHPLFDYAYLTDREEGLVLVNVNTLADGDPRNNRLERALTFNPAGVLDGASHITIGGRHAYVAADAGIVIVDIDTPLQPSIVKILPMSGARATTLQFRYLFAIDTDGLQVFDITRPAVARPVPGARLPFRDAQRLYVARTYLYVAAGKDGLVIVDVENPERPRLLQRVGKEQGIMDARDVVIGAAYASLFAYVADGESGLKVIQLISPDTQPNFYGFSPAPRPQLIARYPTTEPAISLSRGLERDRAVDEDGNQIAVFGRIGSRPLTREEMEALYLDDKGKVWTVED